MILIPIVIISFLILGSWYAYSISFFSPKKNRATVDTPLHGAQYDSVASDIHRISHIMQQYPFEEIILNSHDGLPLYGRYYHVRDGAPIELLFHGYRSHPYRDCSGGHALSRKLGYNALVVDQRAHGNSGGHSICFGIQERHDCLLWANYAARRFNTPLILSGLSMGAATVLMASELQLPPQVCCIIADSPYSSPIGIIEKVCADRHYPPKLCRPFLYLGAHIFGGFPLGAASARDAVKHATVPILLIHGEADHFVPCQMSLEIAAACASRVEVATFSDAGHGLCYMTDPIRYEKVVCKFLESIPALSDTIPSDYRKKLYENP